MDVRLPDGTVIKDVPEGTTKADLVTKLQKNGMAVPSEWLAAKPEPKKESPVAEVGRAIMDIPRQVGLTARYGLEGAPAVVDLFASPFKFVTDKALGTTGKTASEMGKSAADWLGLPKPRTAGERVVGDATRMMAGAGGMGVAGRLAQGAAGLPGQVGEFFAANPMQQIVSSIGAGGAGGAVREAGGGPGMQAGAALLGGIAAPIGFSAGQSAANVAKAKLMPRQATQEVEQQIALTLRQQGIDWSAIPERIKQPMRAEVQQALSTGRGLNPDAVRRLLDFRTVGATPTRGMLTQDPVQITREMNLAKTGANSTDVGLQRLPQLQNQNTNTLLGALDEMGAARALDDAAVGSQNIGALEGLIRGERGNVNSLYSAARDTSGRSASLDGANFSRRANQMLDQEMVGGALPQDVANNLNRIARGEVPFTVDYAEQLKTVIGNLQRNSSDGNARTALGLVRRALDEAPLVQATGANPGNLPAVAGSVPTSPAVLGEQSIAAFNQARSANRQMMQRLEANPALRAVDDAISAARSNPELGTVADIVGSERFLTKYVLGGDVSPRHVQDLAAHVGPQGQQALRDATIARLRSAATNGTNDVAKFSPASYNKALMNIGERKLLAMGFEPEDVRRLQAVGRVGTLMKSQPDGAAVNNSNSGAMLVGRAMDLLDSVAGRLPLGLDTTIQGTLRGVQQGQALSAPGALTLPAQRIPLLQRAATPAILGTLLATQPVE